MKHPVTPAIVVLLACMLAACHELCYDNTSIKVGVAVVDSLSQQHKLQVFSVCGEGSDSVLYQNTALDMFYLPLRKDTTQCAFLFTVGADSLTRQTYRMQINYQNYPQLISPECGCEIFHTLQSASFEADQAYPVSIINSQVQNTANEIHLQIRM